MKRYRMVFPFVFAVLLVLNFGTESNGEICTVPKIDQEFCNSMYSVCLSAPDKLCIANSMRTCLDEVGFPMAIVQSIRDFITEYIIQFTWTIDPEIEKTTMAPPPPPSTRAPSTFPSIIVTGTPPLPEIPDLPTPAPEGPVVQPFPITLPDLPSPPRDLVIIKEPYTPELPEVPTPMPEIAIYGPDYATQRPEITFIYPEPNTVKPEISFIVPEPHQTQRPDIKQVYAFQSGNAYLDYLIAILGSLQHKSINEVIRLMIEQIKLEQAYYGEWQDGELSIDASDIEILIAKLKYILSQYSMKASGFDYLETNLKQLLTTNTRLFMWFTAVVEQILLRLGYDTPEITTYPEMKFGIPVQYYVIFYTTLQERGRFQYCHGAPPSMDTCERYCFDEYGGNWIGIQSRERNIDDPTSFDVSLNQYMAGFGDWNHGYWMGLECIHAITKDGDHELLIELTDASGQTAIAHYDAFVVDNAANYYKLSIGEYMGGALGDSLRISDGMEFTTRDHDGDNFVNGNCAMKHKGGWWYNGCQKLDVENFLNGHFTLATDHNFGGNFPYFGVRWHTWDTKYTIQAVRMFIRKTQRLYMNDPLLG